MTSLLDSPTIAAANPATHLKCRNCSATYELAASHVCMACFAPLEIGYDMTSWPGSRANPSRPARTASGVATSSSQVNRGKF